jgi:hypothetical protein
MRLSRRNLVAMTALATLGAGRPAGAHHGWAGYEEDYTELTGSVVEASFGYPHGELDLEVEGPDRPELWEIVLGPPNRNRRAGLDETTILVGDTVTAIGRRHRDPAVLEIKAERIVKDGRTFDPYPERLRRSGMA